MTSEAQKKAAKTYYENHKEKIAEYHKEYRKNNPEKFKYQKRNYLKWKKWADDNKEDLREYHKEYYQNHKQNYIDNEKRLMSDPIKKKNRRKKARYNEIKSGKRQLRENYRRKISKKLSDEDKKCQICGDLKTQFHHIDYKLFYVGYHLCPAHHRKAHKNPEILSGLNIKNYDYLIKIKH